MHVAVLRALSLRTENATDILHIIIYRAGSCVRACESGYVRACVHEHRRGHGWVCHHPPGWHCVSELRMGGGGGEEGEGKSVTTHLDGNVGRHQRLDEVRKRKVLYAALSLRQLACRLQQNRER